ncbi:MAG: carbon starvation protein A [Muribaculum sp.]|nr:carbon starvation protein A [Muribaculaceae bacterium]MCM1080604.1 carbon starvation protein A [Muribaculum sp.]
MITFLVAFALLIVGYFIYGTLVERIFSVDEKRAMPCYTRRDNIDFIPMPTWKVFLIQFLNIAGMGPIFGAIMGIMFGPAAFLWIVLGTIFAGGVHDFMTGIISERSGGISMPEIVGNELGSTARQFVRPVSLVMLILIGAVFVLTPASLLSKLTPDWMNTQFWVITIFIYYVLATLLPIDKLIGQFYPIFGASLLFMAIGIMSVLIFSDVTIPDAVAEGFHNRSANADTYPIFPMMFVSIACGAISGFHATQSPMMARCLKNEKLARPVFYGAMVAEGIVALIWAAAAIAFTGGYSDLAGYLSSHDGPADLVSDISWNWFGLVGGILAIAGVIAAPITSGDTALRSARLIITDIIKIDQSKILKRILVSLPIFIITYAVMLTDFNVLWRYFAWTNQTLSVFMLWAGSAYLARHGKFFYIAMIPAMFMTCVCTSYILFAPEGFKLDWNFSLLCGCIVALLFSALFVRKFVWNRHIEPAEM